MSDNQEVKLRPLESGQEVLPITFESLDGGMLS